MFFLGPVLSIALCSGTSLTCKRPFQISPVWNTDGIQAPNKILPFAEDLNRVLQERYTMRRALIRWKEPRHASFSIFSWRLLSFDSTWPRKGKSSPEVLSAAGSSASVII